MKALEAYGVQELNQQELSETEGGFIPLLIVGCLLLAGCANGCDSDSGSGGNPNHPPPPPDGYQY